MRARRIIRGRIAVEYVPGVGWRCLVRVMRGTTHRWIPARANDGHRAMIEQENTQRGKAAGGRA